MQEGVLGIDLDFECLSAIKVSVKVNWDSKNARWCSWWNEQGNLNQDNIC